LNRSEEKANLVINLWKVPKWVNLHVQQFQPNPFSLPAHVVEPADSPLQQIHRRRDIMHAEVFRERRIFPGHSLVHRISHIAI
jgi:hypothetical protein